MQESDAVQAFQNGGLDVIDDVSASGIQSLQDVADARVFAAVGRSSIFLGWNLQDGRASELAVRRAAALAVDVPRLIDDFTLGQGERARGPLLPVQGFADTSAVFEYNPERARQLLRQAGWGDSNDNGILDKRGINLHFEILVAAEKTLHRRLATAIAASLREVGFGIDVRVLPTFQLLDHLEGGAFECFIGQWFPDLDANIEIVWSSSILGRFNYAGYQDTAADSLMAVLHYELDPAAREVALQALQRRIYDDQPYLFVLQPPRFTIVSKRVRGCDPNVLSTFWNLPEWWIPRRLQAAASE
jgi:peptide/nickel transport system substrate-binding protein